MSACPFCSHALANGDEMCTRCGRWQNGHAPMCDTHEATLSTGVCAVCLRPLCEACSTSIDGRVVCGDPDHRRIVQEYRLLASLDSEFEADWVLEHLRQGGVSALQFSLRTHAGTRWTPVRHPVRVFVPADAVARSRDLLARFDDLILLPTERT